MFKHEGKHNYAVYSKPGLSTIVYPLEMLQQAFSLKCSCQMIKDNPWFLDNTDQYGRRNGISSSLF